MSELDIQVRVGNLDDIEMILAFLTQKAEFDGYLNTLTVTANKLEQTLFSSSPLATVLFAEVEGTAVGFASSSIPTPAFWHNLGFGWMTFLFNHICGEKELVQLY